MSRKKPKPFWERAYKGHAFWLGRQKLGKVTLLGKDQYAWQAAGRAGTAGALEQAKKAVELAVLMADKQPDLFSNAQTGISCAD
ncbi:MAG TPA: hypothetical protein VFX09_01855 [Burkholderiales bacterium]|nr:hypothetical protein [Burkholderiales bacterium]